MTGPRYGQMPPCRCGIGPRDIRTLAERMDEFEWLALRVSAT